MGLLYIISTSGLVALLGYLFLSNRRYRAKQYTHGCSPPRQYPHKDLTGLGIDLFLETGKMYEEHQFLTTWHRRYEENGTTFEVSTLGTPTFCSCDPVNLQSVFVTNAKKWGVSYRLPALGPYCGPAFLTTDGQAWEHSRALLAPAFQKSIVSNHTDFAHYLDLMLKKIPRNGEPVDLQKLVFSLYLDTATLWLFGESFESLAGEVDKADEFTHSFAYSLGTGGFRMAIGPFQFLHRSKKWEESNRTNQAFIEQYVDRAIERQSKGANKNDTQTRLAVLDLMAQQLHDREQLRNESMHAFIAAHETTACLISNLFWVLARHPNIWARLRAEALAAFGNTSHANNLTFESATKLEYLRKVINETLRLYPVFPYHLRIALDDTTIPVGGGPDGKQPIFCPKGTLFDGNFAELHRQQSIWGADVEEFRPERWDEFKPKTNEFMPFGGGPRACAGRQKALMETNYLVARMLLEFERLVPHDSKEWQGDVQITAKNLHGCVVGFTEG